MFDERFLKQLDTRRLCELTSAADTLQIRSLVDITSKALARLIEGRSAEEIREAFQLPDDLTGAPCLLGRSCAPAADAHLDPGRGGEVGAPQECGWHSTAATAEQAEREAVEGAAGAQALGGGGLLIDDSPEQGAAAGVSPSSSLTARSP